MVFVVIFLVLQGILLGGEIPNKPNIIVLLTDQERQTTHWPSGWAEKNLPAQTRLKANGLTFLRAYTAASECSPSRAVIMTGEHFPKNQVAHLLPPILPTAKQLMDIGEMLTEKGGYEVVYKGKWHLTLPLEEGKWSLKDIENLQEGYGLSGWNPPDAGNAIAKFEKGNTGEYPGLTTLGGGYANNDGRFVEGVSSQDPKQTKGIGESVLDFLEKVQKSPPNERKPFCLFISLVNPHDVWVYPTLWDLAGYKKEDFEHLRIELPENYRDSLETKPSIQKKAREAFNLRSPLKSVEEEKNYVKFYAHLHQVVDRQIEKILEALDRAKLTDNTIIIRTADHGELGLSHGMREKAYTAYEEMIHVPLIVSNPKLYPTPQETDAFYSHLDLLPTLGELAGIPSEERPFGKGVSIVPVLKNPMQSVQDSILFTFDDYFFLPIDTPGGHIRALREGDWTYAVYFSLDGTHFEYELYNLLADPGQMYNLLYGKAPPAINEEARRLHAKLKNKIDHAGALEKNFAWPTSPF